MSRFREALEKAKNNRKDYYQGFFKDEGLPPDPPKLLREKSPKVLTDIQVSYCETKIQDVDPLFLLKNKVHTQNHGDGIGDHFNLLRLQTLNKLKEIGGNSLLITSANAGEGKTFTAINLGICLAQELNRTVLLVDADLRTPKHPHYDFASDFFGIDARKGLADYLLGQAEIPDILLNPGIHKLTILPAGRTLPNSEELLGSSRMVSLVDEMKKRYAADRIIIFDTPSLLYTDPLVLSRYIDGVLLVVEQEKTTAQEVRQTVELLEDLRIIGIVLNKSKSGKTVYV
jgi:non-specific protein-tyrosine kinase